MTSNIILKDTEEKMHKTIENTVHEFATIRTGRASLTLLEPIKIEAYGGNPMPLKQIANLSIPDTRTIQIQPWDISLVSIIEKAILKSNLGITPQNDGKVIRLHMPQLTQERRKDLVKLVHKLAEEGRIAIRNIRRHAIEEYKKMEKNGDIPEDEGKKNEKKVHDLHDKYMTEIDSATKKKEAEIMEI